jgi:hypothetical protein
MTVGGLIEARSYAVVQELDRSRAGTARPQRCLDHDDLHARPEPWPAGSPQPGRSAFRCLPRWRPAITRTRVPMLEDGGKAPTATHINIAVHRPRDLDIRAAAKISGYADPLTQAAEFQRMMS